MEGAAQAVLTGVDFFFLIYTQHFFTQFFTLFVKVGGFRIVET